MTERARQAASDLQTNCVLLRFDCLVIWTILRCPVSRVSDRIRADIGRMLAAGGIEEKIRRARIGYRRVSNPRKSYRLRYIYGTNGSYGFRANLARVSGYLQKINFKEGAEVNLDDVLYEIDPRPYEAALEQAKAITLVLCSVFLPSLFVPSLTGNSIGSLPSPLPCR